MGKKNKRRLRLLLLACAFLGLKVLPFAASYTSATIFNSASVRITDNSNALIAVHLPSEVVCFPGNSISGKIVNNMGVPLHSLTATNALLTSSGIGAGGSAKFAFIAPSKSGPYEGKIEARWANGSANIPYSVDITIVDPHVVWDETLERVIVKNNSDYSILVQVGNASKELGSDESALFERTGDKTTVFFSIGEYSTHIECETYLQERQIAADDESLEDEDAFTDTHAENTPIQQEMAEFAKEDSELQVDLPIETEILPAEEVQPDDVQTATTPEASEDVTENTAPIINP